MTSASISIRSGVLEALVLPAILGLAIATIGVAVIITAPIRRDPRSPKVP